MARYKDYDWSLLPPGAGEGYSWKQIEISLLMDIRDVLREVRGNTNALTCHNAQAIPRLLRQIARQTNTGRCRKHPRYRGLRPPKMDCIVCRRMFRRRNVA